MSNIKEMAPGIEPIACTMETAAQLSGYSNTRLYAAIAAGRLKSWKVGKRRMTTPAFIREMIVLDQRQSEGSDAA